MLLEHALELWAQRTTFNASMPRDFSMRVNFEEHWDLQFSVDYFRRVSALPEESENREIHLDILVESLAAFVVPHIFGPLHLQAFYLPAARTGVMSTYKTVAGGLIGSAPMSSARTAALGPTLAGYLADFLQQLVELDREPQTRSKSIREIGTQIERVILDGSVHVEQSKLIGFPFFTYQPTGWKDRVPLMNASSMVSEIAPVVLFLRSLVRPGNVLIIEEPESSLHPEMQVEFIRQLASLVRAGVRVIVTTHSEWVLEELSNLVLTSSLPEARRNGIGGGQFALRPEDVGAWWFQPKKRPRGSVVQEIGLEKSGLYSSTFDRISASTYNDWVRISERIGEGE